MCIAPEAGPSGIVGEMPPGKVVLVQDESCVNGTVTGRELVTFVLDSVRQAREHLEHGALKAVEHRLDVIDRVLSRMPP